MSDRGWNDRRNSMANSSTDDPPHSRLFIISSKSLCESDFREAFEEYGNIEELWLVKDRNSGEFKGVTYIKYEKTSEAARALEAMNGKSIGGMNRSIKVMVASSREQGSVKDTNEEERTQRLFVVVPKTLKSEELYDHFKTFGDIDYANIVSDRNTGESKGFAYVKFHKFSDAALAYEECSRQYRAVFAEPRVPRNKLEEKSFPSESYSSRRNSIPLPEVHTTGDTYNKLIVIASPYMNQDLMWKLFDIVPGLDYCQVRQEGRPVRAVGQVVYTSAQWAAHAKEKLHGFEYPPGDRLIVKPDFSGNRSFSSDLSTSPLSDKRKPDILKIAETIAQASSLIQAAGLSPSKFFGEGILQTKLGFSQDLSDTSCSVPLPDPKPMANIDDDTAARCFIVCVPSALPNSVLKDIFCRFGGLIDVYMLHNRNHGYAKFTSKESAVNAIKTLHGAEVNGTRIKVLEAEERSDTNRKRQKMDD